jgi:flavin-dependent dehydrogenase
MRDVVVIGAGPAGCAAAIGCAMRGLSVTIVDRSAGRGDRPGETLHPGVEVIFENLGIADAVDRAAFIRHAGTWADGVFQPFGNGWRGYQALASQLDPILLDRAIACGAEVVREVAERPIVEERRIAGIVAGGAPIRARVVIDATGRRQWLASALGLPLDVRSEPLTAVYGYLRHCDDDAPRFVTLANGWSWTAPIGERRAAWVRLAPAAETAKVIAEAPELESPARAADVTWRLAVPTAGRGYFLAGDAAFVLDPSSGHGVLKALLSATQAARCAADLLHGRAPAGAIALGYTNWITAMFEHDVAKLRAA